VGGLLFICFGRVTVFSLCQPLDGRLKSDFPVNTWPGENVYHYVRNWCGVFEGAGARLGLFAESPGRRAVREQVASGRPEDGRMVEAARAGDRVAFGQLYDRYARMVHGVLMARVPLNDVDDLVQDVFVLALRRLSTLRDVQSFGAWLAAIARNLANDYHRRPREMVASSEDPSASEIAGTSVTHEGEATVILAVIKTLPDAYKETLILRLVEGMTGPEIAERTGLSPGSVRVNLHRGMQQLREKLGPDKTKGTQGERSSL
jgi:RNA polymerase sigma-70 factor, ECF subfamily